MAKEISEKTALEVRHAYNISSDIQSVIAEIVDNGGECNEEQFARLNGLKMELADKAQSICHVRKQMEANLEYWKAAKAFADEKIKAREKAIKWLAEYLCGCMKQADITSFKDNKMLFSISVCKGRPSIVVDDVNALDVGFFEVVKKPIAKAIKEAIDRGEEVNGAHVEIGKDYCMIRQGKGSSDND